MKKIYLGIGINKYKYLPETNLTKCVDDVQRMSKAMQRLGFTTFIHVDEECTKGNIVNYWKSVVASVPSHEKAIIVIHHSSHGSQVPSTTEPDGADECLLAHDTDWDSTYQRWKNVIIDDEVERFLNLVPENITIEFMFDTCHSGDMARGAVPPMLQRNRRFVYPRNYIVKKIVRSIYSGHIESNSRHIFLLGTSSDKYSYEDYEGGAMTTAMCKTLDIYYPFVPTREQAIKAIIDYIKYKKFDQLPHYECRSEAMKWCVFDLSDEKKTKPIQRSPNWLIRLLRNIFRWILIKK